MSTQPDSVPFDLLLKNGHVIDPKRNLSQPMDVAIASGRIARIAQDIPASQARKVVDLAGCYVTPGLIDIHVHVYPPCFSLGLIADAHSFSSGVTTMVDAGTAGAANFADFKAVAIDRSKTRIYAYLNIVDLGMGGDYEQDVSRMQPEQTARVADEYAEYIVGIKAAHYWVGRPWDATHAPWDNVERAVRAGELCHKPVMVDFWPRPPERSYADLILVKLRPGDIHTHIFGQQFPIVDEAARLNPVLLEARQRGIIFDLGHGAGSFWFRNAVPAIQQGFVPDSFGTDLHIHNVNGPVVNLITTMSKLMNIGLSIEEVVRRATVTPAQEIGHPELGTLDVGAEADVAVFRRLEGTFGFADCGKARMMGTQMLQTVLTLRRGDVVFDPTGVTMPEWHDAPAVYWVCAKPTG